MMDSRIRSNVARGRSIINDSAILPLFEKLTNWHGEVLARMAKLDEDRGMGYLLVYVTIKRTLIASRSTMANLIGSYVSFCFSVLDCVLEM